MKVLILHLNKLFSASWGMSYKRIPKIFDFKQFIESASERKITTDWSSPALSAAKTGSGFLEEDKRLKRAEDTMTTISLLIMRKKYKRNGEN